MVSLSNLALKSADSARKKETESDMMSVPDACRFLAVSRNTLYKLIQVGELPAFRLVAGGHWKLRRADLSDWLETRKARSGV